MITGCVKVVVAGSYFPRYKEFTMKTIFVPSDSPNHDRVPELDGLRGVGTLAILAFHLWPEKFFFGWTRVDLFFVISGYLITKICLKYDGDPGFLPRFYTRRALRTWPIYYLISGIGVICMITSGNSLSLFTLAVNLTFNQTTPLYWSNQFFAISPYFLHTWSLVIEEQFYILWPFVVKWSGPKWLIPVAAFLAIDSVVLRASGVHPWTLAARCDGLAMGAILAVMSRPGRAMLLFVAVTSIAVLLLVFEFLTSDTSLISHMPQGIRGSIDLLLVNLFYFGVVGFVVTQTGRTVLKPLQARSIRTLGQFSYGIYMTNYIIIYYIYNSTLFPHDAWWCSPAMFAICIIVGWFSWTTIEMPIYRFKDLWPYRGVS